MVTVCFLLGDEQPGYDLQGSPVRRGSYPSIVVPTGTKQGVQSPLERRPSSISTDRPQMESRPYGFLLQLHRGGLLYSSVYFCISLRSSVTKNLIA